MVWLTKGSKKNSDHSMLDFLWDDNYWVFVHKKVHIDTYRSSINCPKKWGEVTKSKIFDMLIFSI